MNQGDPLTDLRVDLTVRDLGEYNQLLTTLGLEGNGNKGSAAIPVVLHGAIEFNGTAQGEDCGPGCEGACAGTRTWSLRWIDGCADGFAGCGCGVLAEFRCGGGKLDDQARERGVECEGEDETAQGGVAARGGDV